MGELKKKINIFGADMSSSVHVDNGDKNILILREELTQELDYTTLTVEAKCPVNFTQPRKRFVLSLHSNGSNSFLFFSVIKICQFNTKDSKMEKYTLCLGNISKDFTVNNMKNKRIKRKCIFFWWF